MSSDLLGTKNVFTTRFGGVSGGDYASLNLGSDRGDDPDCVRENHARLCSLFGVGPDDACVTKQVHGNVVREVTEKDKHVCLSVTPYVADGLVTACRRLPLICLIADCVPVLLADGKGRAVAAVHCGWRSSVADILGNAVAAMEALGAEAKDIRAALGPALGQCCFESDADVVEAIEAYIGPNDCCIRRGAKYFIDLRGANRIRLLQLGLLPENIDVSDECTFCLHEKYWSHRYTLKNNLNRGSQVAGIMLE